MGKATISKDVSVGGGITAGGVISATSDIRYKTQVRAIDNALEKILGLEGVYYQFDAKKFPEKNFSSQPRVGLIAQNVESVFPEAVVKDSKGFLSVAYGDLVGPIIQAIKELYASLQSHQSENQKVVQEIKTEMDQLRKENELLRQKIELLSNQMEQQAKSGK